MGLLIRHKCGEQKNIVQGGEQKKVAYLLQYYQF